MIVAFEPHWRFCPRDRGNKVEACLVVHAGTRWIRFGVFAGSAPGSNRGHWKTEWDGMRGHNLRIGPLHRCVTVLVHRQRKPPVRLRRLDEALRERDEAVRKGNAWYEQAKHNVAGITAILVERDAALARVAELELICEGEREHYTARVLELEDALRGLRDATDPWVEDAAPQEEMDGLWCHRFDVLSAAREVARVSLGLPATPTPGT